MHMLLLRMYSTYRKSLRLLRLIAPSQRFERTVLPFQLRTHFSPCPSYTPKAQSCLHPIDCGLLWSIPDSNLMPSASPNLMGIHHLTNLDCQRTTVTDVGNLIPLSMCNLFNA